MTNEERLASYRDYYCRNRDAILEKKRAYREKNASRIRESVRRCWEKNGETYKETQKIWRENNRDSLAKKARKYNELNRERLAIIKKEWKARNPHIVRESARKRDQKKRSTAQGRLYCSIATQVWRALRERKAGRKWERVVGYTVLELTEHIEKLFLEDMSWDNYGEWHVDHIIPQTKFDLSNNDEFRLCWSLNNLQPLWALDNIRKSNKVEE